MLRPGMRHAAFVLVLWLCQPGSGFAQNAHAPIFRYISIAPYGIIRLGEPFRQLAALGAPVRDGLYRLVAPADLPTQFGDTDAILIELDAVHNVRALYFAYLPGGDAFDDRTRDYQTDLGPPTASERDSAGTHVDRRSWQDSATSFELLEISDSSGTRIMSELRDLLPPHMSRVEN